MVEIVADDSKIEKEIHNLLDILIGAGSGFHSNLLIYEHDGGLSIKTKEPMEDGKEIIRLPRTVLMPGDQYLLEISGNDFVVHYPENSIVTDLQRRVIDKMYEIYNLTNKVKLHEEFSFLLSLRDTPSLIDKVAEARDFVIGQYEDWVNLVKSEMTEDQYHTLICETYVKTRPLGYSDPIRESSVSMIMPVLDFMNHHWSGGNFSVGQGKQRKGDLTMQSAQPYEGSTECFANYGIMDAFDTLIRYDFIDESAPILRSVAVELDAPGGDCIKIQNNLGFYFKEELDKNLQDLRRHLPDIKVSEDQVIASHVFLPTDQSPFALIRVLHLILNKYNSHNNIMLSPEETDTWIVQAQEKIVEKNTQYYQELLDDIEVLPQEQRDSFGVSRLKALADHQMSKIKGYQIQTTARSSGKAA